ncbi:MAG: LysM peptidoglycan-binding domain-containing protein [Gammaproteobacteria bacterium]|nr:LysM peptidoglycan-binding domain-containing protein [Gammaproteobacteria bacterium]
MKIRNTLKFVLLLMAIAVSTAVNASNIELADNHPVDYTVVEGDTLWGISGKFLKDPWRWPEIWKQNNQIQNPDLIYPGDHLVLRYNNGQPYLEHLSGRDRAAKKVVKMSPVVYIEALDDAIPSIPPKYIMAFLQDRQIVASRNLDNLAYVTEGVNHEVILGGLSDMYVRKIDGAPGSKFKIIRMRGELFDPETKKSIAFETETLGEAEMIRPGDPAKLRIIKASKEVHQGDRLVPAVVKLSLPYYHPKAFREPLSANILGAESDMAGFGPGDVITLAAGSDKGLEPGHVLQIMRDNGVQKDPVTGNKYRLPVERSGIVMVFKTYGQISYGLIMRATQGIRVFDKVTNIE